MTHLIRRRCVIVVIGVQIVARYIYTANQSESLTDLLFGGTESDHSKSS